MTAILKSAQFYSFGVSDCVFHFKTVFSRSLQTFAAFWPKIAEYVTKNLFSKKNSGRVFLKFRCKTSNWCRIMYWKFLEICCLFNLSMKYGRVCVWGNIYPPQRCKEYIRKPAWVTCGSHFKVTTSIFRRVSIRGARRRANYFPRFLR